MRVRFTSDAATVREGFVAIMTSESSDLVKTSTCATSGETRIEFAGIVSDGAGRYSANARCSWIIAPTGAQAITVKFTMLNTEANRDTVAIALCNSATDCQASATAIYSGTTIPALATYNVPAIRITLTTDRSNHREGFVAVYSAGNFLQCANGADTAVTAPMAVIWDRDGMYANNLACSWTSALQAPTIEFVQLDTQAGVDIVYVDECPA
jgi:hypothetical protein